MTKKGLIFDFDGVLVDSFDTVYQSVLFDNPDLTKKQFRRAFEMHFYDVVNTYAFSLENYRSEFKKRIDSICISNSVLELLEDFYSNFDLHIVSSNYEDFIDIILKRSNADHLFDSVLGWDTSEYKSKKFENIFNGGKAEDYFFITDTSGDIHEAHQVSLDSLGYTGGFHSRETLEKAEPRAIIDTLEYINTYL